MPKSRQEVDVINVVAVHGNGGGAFRFEPTLPYIPPGVNFVAVTLPGFANAPRDPALQSVTDYARHLHTLVANELAGTRPLILLGTGIGGSFALEYIQQYEAEVDGLILHAPVGTRLDTRLFPRLMRLPGMRQLAQWTIATPLLRPLFRRLLFTQRLPDDIVDRFFDEYRQCSVFGQMFDLITAEWFNSLQPRQIPTALLWGERERVLTVDQLNDYKDLLPNHIVRTVAGWDHFPMLEQPEAFAREITRLSQELIALGWKRP